jgi:cyclophilin family peptidyl-prolyl cis-trans isomerase
MMASYRDCKLATVPARRLQPRIIGLCVAGAVALVAACGGDGDGEGEDTATRNVEGNGGCQRAREPRPRRVRKRRPPGFRLSPDKRYIATVVTSCGTFGIELDSRQAARTGGSFVALAREGFYDGLRFHRVVRGFVIQGGDPKGTGTGGPGYSIREPPPDDVAYSEGTVAMAKTEAEPPGTSGSQFFVVTSDNALLDPVYAILGQVVSGLEVVHRIERLAVGPDERPLDPVIIERIDVEAR